MNQRLKKVDAETLGLIAQGSTVLGAGGGGDPYIGRLMAQAVLGAEDSVDVIPLDDLTDDALVLPIAMMGAPQVMQEKFPSGREIPRLIDMMERLLERKVSAILCIEAGGLNATIPFIAAAQLGLPIVDADAMGRAFPELQMVTLTLGGMAATPMAMIDDKGNCATFDTISNAWTERLARALTIEMGGSAMVALYPFLARQGRSCLIDGSLSLACAMGKILEDKKSTAAATLADRYGGRVLFSGRVRDVTRNSSDGFTKGTLALEGQQDYAGHKMSLSFQNEFLAAWMDGEIQATTPDLITLLDAHTGAPITTDIVKYGLSVHVLGLPCASIWRSEKALELVGPKYFGIDVDYTPLKSGAEY